MSARLLRSIGAQAASVRQGRPPHGAGVRRATLVAAARVLRSLRYGVGWRTVARALPGAPTVLLKAWVPEFKRRHRAKGRRIRARHRVRLVVERPGVLVTQDGFQASGTRGAPVMAELLRDAATAAYEGGSVGGATVAADVIALLTALEASGRRPLALGTDNGVYQGAAVQAYLAARQIIWFPSRRRTPQDNGGMERGIREVQEATGEVEALGARAMAERIARTAELLNASVPRGSRGGMTANELTAWMPVCEADVRDRFFAAATAAIATAVAAAPPRQARAAQREAVLQSFEKFELARRIRGDGA